MKSPFSDLIKEKEEIITASGLGLLRANHRTCLTVLNKVIKGKASQTDLKKLETATKEIFEFYNSLNKEVDK